MANSVGIRLGVDAASAKQEITAFGDVGDAQAKRFTKSFEQAGDDVTAALARQARAAEKIAALMPSTPTQQIYQAGASTNYGGQSARDSAAAMKELMAAEEQLTARTNAFRASIDPAWVAQGRFNAQMAEARSLISQGAISLDQYCDKLRIETAALKSSSGAADGVVSGHSRMSTSSMILQHVMRSTTDSFAAGLPVTMILGEQMARLGEAASYAAGEGEGKGKLAGLAKFMAGPWGLAFTAAIGVAGALIPKLFEGADAADVMKEHQEALAAVMDRTTGKITEQSKALLLNAAIMAGKDAKAAKTDADAARRSILSQAEGVIVPGGIGDAQYINQDPRVTSAIAAFAKTNNADQLSATMAALGKAVPQLKGTTEAVIAEAAAFTTAGRAIEQHNAQVRLLNGQGRPGDQRKALGEFSPEKPDLSRVEAEAKVLAATKDSDRATAQATITRIDAKKAYDNGTISLDQYRAKLVEADKAEDAAKQHTDKHAEALARQAASMEVAARGAINVASAYLQSSDAGAVAEAKAKAATDATKRGIDVDAQAARQMALSAAQRVETAAKAVASMNDESAAREVVVGQVKSGVTSASDMDMALQKEVALRPLLAARAYLHGDALKTLNDVIDATTAAIDRSTVAAGKFDLGKQIEASRKAAIDTLAQIGDLGRNPLDATRNAAVRAAGNAADAAHLAVSDPQRGELARSKVGEADATYAYNKAKFVTDTVQSQQDSIELAQRELQLAGSSDAYRTSELDKLKLQQQIRRTFPDMAKADVDKLIAGVAAIDAANEKAKLLQDTWSEIRSAGDSFLSDLTNPDGSGLKNLLSDVEQEFIKLAALNPLKNLLLGEKNPTLGSLFSALSGTSKDVANLTDAAASNIASATAGIVPRNASGTEYFSGGSTWLAENGPEMVTLPAGSKVSSAPATRRMLAGNDNTPAEIHQHFYLDGAIVDQALYQQMAAIGDNAAARGAAGGAQLAQANAAKRVRYRIPGR